MIILNYGLANYQAYPWREPEAPWLGLLAEVLLQRTNAKTVQKHFKDISQIYPSAYTMSISNVPKIKEVIHSLGLHWRSKHLFELGKAIVSLGDIPNQYERLLELPGVGQYAASAYLSFHGNRRAILIDANTVRFACRYNDVKYDGETRRQAWVKEFIEGITPRLDYRNFNYALLDFTMQICKTGKPQCSHCELRRTCKATLF